MVYHDDLLEQALLLIHKEPGKPKQASLRRAVSAAYYALFHFLISEAVANWKQVNLRPALSRSFDHGVMKAASNRIQNKRLFPFTGANPSVAANLRSVAQIFAELQEKRHIADYDNTTFWTRTDALLEVNSAEEAFKLWKQIRKEKIAQEYLVSLLFKKRD